MMIKHILITPLAVLFVFLILIVGWGTATEAMTWTVEKFKLQFLFD